MSFHQFKYLGDNIWLYEPRDSGEGDEKSSPVQGSGRSRQTGQGHQPALIILCTWLGGATTKRIEKYTKGYHRLWPSSKILLIRTTIGQYLFRSNTNLRRKLRPAHREIRRLGLQSQCQHKPLSEPEDGGIVLHIFSLGGSNTATQLLESTNAVLSTLGQQGPLPLRQIVLDSCPGDPGVHSSYAAGAHSLPDIGFLRPFSCAAMYILAAGLAGMEATGLRAPLARIMRSQLNDTDMFSAKATRLYLTSEADSIVDSRDVEKHRNQAAAKGLTTDILRFHRAGHCSLLLEDDDAYWNAIASGWDKSAAANSEQRTGHGQDARVPHPPSMPIKMPSQPRSRL